MAQQIIATFIAARWAQPKTNGYHSGIWRLTNSEQGDFIGLGSLPDQVLVSGLDLSLRGDWVMHQKYGPQFKFTHAAVVHKAGKDGVIAFLQQGIGIGAATADKIYRQYGDQAIEILAKQPDRVKREMPFLKQVDTLSEFFKNSLIEATTKIPLIDLLYGISFPHITVDRILEKKWPDPLAFIKENPFRLLPFTGCSFLRCDALRKKVGLPSSFPPRRSAALMHVLDNHSETIWIRRAVVKRDLGELLGTAEEFDEIVTETIADKQVAKIGPWLAKYEDAVLEKEIAKLMMEKLEEQADWPSLKTCISLTGHQAKEMNYALQNGSMAFLLGLPGSGKSFCAAQLIKAYGKQDVILCAPTGKAAQRLTEVLGINSLKATTIHRALGARPQGDGFLFTIDGENGNFLPAGLVVVDETSMLDNRLFYRLLKAVGPGTLLLLLGDPSQLSAVGKGSLLRDWQLFSKKNKQYTFGLLQEIHRNSGTIIETCARISARKPISWIKVENPGHAMTRANLQLRECRNDEIIQKDILQFYDRAKYGIVTADGRYQFDLSNDIQVITANNDTIGSSRREINKLLQPILNTNPRGRNPFYKIGDKVIVTKNMLVPIVEGSEEVAVMNGETGIVTRSEESFVHVRMRGGDAVVLRDMSGLDLGYAVSVHKAQGSEWPVILVVCSNEFKARQVTDRGWLITAITRAQKMCFVFSAEKTLDAVGNRDYLSRRRSFIGRWWSEGSKYAVPV